MKNSLKSLLLSTTVACAILAPAVVSANAEVEKLSHDPANWATWGGDYFGSRFSTLTQINKDNAKTIQPIWTFSTGALRGHEGGPLVVNGLIYIHTGFPHKIYALSQDTHSVVWEYD